MDSKTTQYLRRSFLFFILLVTPLLAMNCFNSDKALPGLYGTGELFGKVVGPDGAGIASVTITTTHQGNVLTTTSSSSGRFSFTLPDVKRGVGYNVNFAKTNFETANHAAVVSLPNLKVDMGNVVIYVTGGSATFAERTIFGQITGNFSHRGLAGVNVYTTDTAGHFVTAVTDANGEFVLRSFYFAEGSSFALTAELAGYIDRTDITAYIGINSLQNRIDNNPIAIYNLFGRITAYVTEDSLGTVLNGVSVKLKNSNNQDLTCTTNGPYNARPLQAGEYCPDMKGLLSPITNIMDDNAGGARIENDFLFVGKRYDITISKTSANCTARVNATTDCFKTVQTYANVTSAAGDNPVSGQKVPLYWDSWIHGLISPAGSGATVKLYDSSNTFLTQTTTDGTGRFVLDNPSIKRAGVYKITVERSGYSSRLIGSGDVPVTVTIAGANNAGTIVLTPLPPPTHCVRGTVRDYWSTMPIPGATVAIFDASNGWRTAITDNLGEFNIGGNFSDTTVDKYKLQIAKPPGYTGETEVAKQVLYFTHSGVAACPGSPFDLDSAAVGACGASGVGPTGGASCSSQLVLYPVGVFAAINGTQTFFTQQIKQTYERFLTDKNGLTISARNGQLLLTSDKTQRAYDYDGIYLHFDDTPKQLPAVPEGKWSNHVPVNALTTKCTPTVTVNCSPRANGVLTESIGNDIRILPWDIKTYVFYHFYAAAAGAYTIQTTGSTDTYITLIAQTGANMGSDDDSGSGSNAKIGPINLLRGWYYIKVSNKGNNVFGFFDVQVDGPVADESNYTAMLTPTRNYATNCKTNNGDLVVSWYSSQTHLLYIAAPGEDNTGGCGANAIIEKHGPVGEIIRGRFDGTLRPIAAGGGYATITATMPTRGFFNILRNE